MFSQQKDQWFENMPNSLEITPKQVMLLFTPKTSSFKNQVKVVLQQLRLKKKFQIIIIIIIIPAAFHSRDSIICLNSSPIRYHLNTSALSFSLFISIKHSHCLSLSIWSRVLPDSGRDYGPLYEWCTAWSARATSRSGN